MGITDRILQQNTFLATRLYNLHFILCLLFIPCILYAKAGITICYIAWLILAILYSLINGLKLRLKAMLSHPVMSLAFIYLLIVLSGIHTSEIAIWQEQLRVYLPFALLPLAFLLLPSLRSDDVIYLHLWLLLTMTFVSAVAGGIALSDMSSAIAYIGVGQAIDTPIEHVKFSMFNAYAVLSGCLLYRHPRLINYKKSVLSCVIILFITMHILAVRTGLVIVYLLFAVLLVKDIRTRRSWTKLVVIGVAIGVFMISSVQLIPSLKAKWGYMRYDWQMHQIGQGDSYSDSDRWAVNRLAIDSWAEHLWIGVGGGDAKVAMQIKADEKEMNKLVSKLPHSQYLLVGLRTGILGLLVFLIAWCWPLRVVRQEFKWLIGMLYSTYGISFLVENSFERSISVGFFLFFALLMMNYNEKSSDKEVLAHA